MFPKAEVFERNYSDYLARIGDMDFISVKDILGVKQAGDKMIVPFFGKNCFVSEKGIIDESGSRPDYVTCVIISKYILSVPDICHQDTNWVSFKDFKETSHFLNVNYFASDAEKAIVRNFSGKMDSLFHACKRLGGIPCDDIDIAYDLIMQFSALPRISLLLLFNEGDDEFPAQSSVLFHKHSEYYLDPESLAMTGAFLAKSLKNSAQ